MKGTLDVLLVYGANTQHMELVEFIVLDLEIDLQIRRSLAVGLVQSHLLKVEIPIILYDRLCIQKSGAKETLEDMVKSTFCREKFKLFLNLVNVFRR